MTMKPYYWLNNHSRTFLERGYLAKDEDPEIRIKNIAQNAEKILKIKNFAEKFEHYMSLGYYSLSTPVWTNYGNQRGLPVSCFNSHISDRMDSILYKVAEVGMMSKLGGGTSGYFGDLRSRGSSISVGGESSGPAHFMELFDKVSDVISQGSARRGSFAAYLPVEHSDIEEFLQIRNEGHPIQNMSIGITITDSWMNSMVSGDKDKRKIWAKIIQKRFESGYPYLFFTDTVNNNAPQVYKDKKLKINSSNLCVTGDQRVVSNFGLLTAKELYDIGDNMILFDNNKKVNASNMRLVEKNADVYRITLDNGMTHTITKYHKVCIFDYSEQNYLTNTHKVFTKNIECENLKIGDRVAIQTNKGIFGTKNMGKEAFLLGLYQGDGTQYKDQIMIDIWEKDFDLLATIESHHDYICKKYKTQYSAPKNRLYNNAKFHTCVVNQSKIQKKRLCSKALKKSLNFQKDSVPNWIWESNEKTQWQYIKGLYYADGTVFKAKSIGEPISISLANINRGFLQQIQLILANLGMQSSIRILRKAGKQYLPDGKGGYKFYDTKDCWRLIIGNKADALIFNKHTGFLDRKGVFVENRQYRNNTKKFYKIINIEYVGKEDVYCCKVDSPDHLWVCNGIITHNCSEITLNSDENNSFVCVLSSLNLLHWDEIEKTDAIETLIYFLDSVNQEFVNKTENIRFMKSARNFALNQRALGMGVLGWHSYLQSRMIGFESMQAKLINNNIWQTIREKADKASIVLAEKFGEAPILEGYGRRNVTTLAVAPTTSSSFILGQVSPSIEPLNSNYFVKNLAKGKFTYKNPFLKETLKKYDKNDDNTWKSILVKGGSVQHLKFLSNEEKEVFKTFGEISQKEIVIQASQRQKFIDQSQSLNLMIPPDTQPKQVSDLLIEGWRMGIKTFYYQRSANPAQELARNILSCSSCES
jgi:ribonucleoside-diphosphate reductase alpha chain